MEAKKYYERFEEQIRYTERYAQNYFALIDDVGEEDKDKDKVIEAYHERFTRRIELAKQLLDMMKKDSELETYGIEFSHEILLGRIPELDDFFHVRVFEPITLTYKDKTHICENLEELVIEIKKL